MYICAVQHFTRKNSESRSCHCISPRRLVHEYRALGENPHQSMPWPVFDCRTKIRRTNLENSRSPCHNLQAVVTPKVLQVAVCNNMRFLCCRTKLMKKESAHEMIVSSHSKLSFIQLSAPISHGTLISFQGSFLGCSRLLSKKATACRVEVLGRGLREERFGLGSVEGLISYDW